MPTASPRLGRQQQSGPWFVAEFVALRALVHSWSGFRVIAAVFVCECVVLLAPLLLASLARPFGAWDYLTAPDIYLPFGISGLGNAWRNYLHNLGPTATSRPTYALVINLQYLVLGGEFWIWYLVKWAAKAGCVAGVDLLLRKYGVSSLARLATASLLLFHPVAFELMLFSADGWVVVFGIGTIVATLYCVRDKNGRFADLSAIPVLQLSALAVLFFLSCGVKEAALAFALAWLIVAHLDTRKDWRLLSVASPFYLSAGWLIWKLAVASRLRTANFSSSSGGVGVHWPVLLGHFQSLVPSSQLLALPIVFAIAGGLSLRQFARNMDAKGRSLYLLLCIWGFGAAVFSSTTDVPASRYMVPSLFALAVPFGLGMDALKGRYRWIAAGFAVLFPVLTAGDQYRQALAYQQNFYEMADTLAFVQSKAAEGYRVCLTGENGDIPLENQAAFLYFFQKFGPLSYGQERETVIPNVSKAGLPGAKAVLVARYSPKELIAAEIPGLTLGAIRQVYVFRRGGYGILEKMAVAFDHLDSLAIGRLNATYDNGAPVVTTTPQYHVYVIERRCAVEECGDKAAVSAGLAGQFTNFTTLISQPAPLLPGRTYTFEGGPGEVVKLQVPLERMRSAAALMVQGKYHVDRGGVMFGITDENGRDVWNTALSGAPEWHEIPPLPAVPFPTGGPYYLFFYGRNPRGVAFSLRDLKISSPPVIELPGMRRFGALAW